jgi:hypothetical protein
MKGRTMRYLFARLLIVMLFVTSPLLAVIPLQAQQATADYTSTPAANPPAATAGGTTISTTAPVTADTKISVGTYAGEVLTWLAAAFSIPIGALITAWLVRVFQSAGLVMTKQMSDEINKVLVNGMNDAALNGAKLSSGKLTVAVKDPIVASAIQYTIDRMPDTLKGLGLDPKDGKTVEVLRARIATLAADPATPTPPLAPAVKVTPIVGDGRVS